jgi:hypothetical protein
MKRVILFMKNNYAFFVLIYLSFFVLSGTANAERLVREFNGNKSITTAEFVVKEPWILDWRVNSNFKESMGLEVSLVDAKTGFLIGRILKTKYAGNGVKMFNKDGRYRLRISSSLTNWNFKIKELSVDEADSYSAKSQ